MRPALSKAHPCCCTSVWRHSRGTPRSGFGSARLKDFRGEDLLPTTAMASSKRPTAWEQSDEEDEGQGSGSEGHGSLDDLSEGKAPNDAQAPKFAQYMDSDEAGEEDDSSDEAESDYGGSGLQTAAEPFDEEKHIRKEMQSIPFSKLVRAKQSLRQDGSEGEESDSEEDEFRAEQSKGEVRARGRHKELERRDNKHAPTELSSRKPVSRRRTVVELQGNATPRDPRFSSLSASLPNSGLFRTSYGFLKDQQSSEVTELKGIYSKLKRQEANHAGPKAKSALAQSIREEKEKVEAALRRAEGRENERRKREREAEVIKREKKAIQQRVKEGGKPFFLKDSAKKQLILKDKFDRLTGGRKEGDTDDSSSRKDLKRAIERRRKKNAAKERREMPIGGASSTGPEQTGIPKRKRAMPTIEASKPARKRGKRG